MLGGRALLPSWATIFSQFSREPDVTMKKASAGRKSDWITVSLSAESSLIPSQVAINFPAPDR
jgi:hypothetical protein